MSERLRLITEYRAGLEAEIALLRHLATLADTEREIAQSERSEQSTTTHDAPAADAATALDDIVDARDQVMAALVSLDASLRPIREALRDSGELAHLQEYRDLAALHQEAAALAADILAADEQSLAAFREAELARRFAAESIEKGESTLAAYRRVVMPSVASATLVNRRG